MNKLGDWLKDYFGFSATELRGFWLLCFLSSILLFIVGLIKPVFILAKRDTTHLNVKQAQLDSLVVLLDHSRTDENRQGEVASPAVLFKPFDPNVASKELLVENSLPDWLAERIIKYRNRGGKFLIKNDLLKIYGFPADLHSKLYSYIQLPEVRKATNIKQVNYQNPEKRTSNTQSHGHRKIKKMNINTVDSITLQELPGIGVVLSARIVRFREKLGGFHSLDQLSEIYHISPEVVKSLRKHTYLTSEIPVNKININADDVSTLAGHPYISYPLARAIVKHRENYGSFEKLEDCREVYLMQESTFQKLRPYLTF